MQKKGFTLIEMLVAVAILGTLGLLSSIIFFVSLRGASKADILREAKQNGDFAITSMERMIRNATSITAGCPGTGNSLSIKNTDNNITTFSLAGSQIASVSSIGTSNLTSSTKIRVAGLSFDCSRNANHPDVVTVSFTVSQVGTSAFPEETASINFKTTVSLRTY